MRDEAGGRIDGARAPHRHEEVAVGERLEDARHRQRHLPEPDDVGAQLRAAVAARHALEVERLVLEGRAVARLAAGRAQLAVHVQHAARARLLVQRVDVLRAEEEPVYQLLAETGQREVRGVGLDVGNPPAALGVETPDQQRVALEAFGRGHVLDAVLLPEAVRIAKGRHAALGADARAGEHEDPLPAPDAQRRELAAGSDLRQGNHGVGNGCASGARRQGSPHDGRSRTSP